jgi:WD repeat-containing protein 70
MNKSMNSFRILTPIDGHIVQNISYSCSEQEILVVSANAQPKVLSREGKELVECLKGDQYIRDMKHTMGHVSMCYDGLFHPKEN